MLRNNIGNHNIPAGCGSGNHKSSGLNLVRYNAECSAVKFFNASDFNNISSCAFNIRPHRVQKVSYINHMRLFSGTVYNSNSVSKCGCQHYIDCGAYRYDVKIDCIANKLVCRYINHPILYINFCSKRFKPLNMLVNRANSKITASWQSYASLFKPAQQSTHKVRRRTYLSYAVI